MNGICVCRCLSMSRKCCTHMVSIYGKLWLGYELCCPSAYGPPWLTLGLPFLHVAVQDGPYNLFSSYTTCMVHPICQIWPQSTWMRWWAILSTLVWLTLVDRILSCPWWCGGFGWLAQCLWSMVSTVGGLGMSVVVCLYQLCWLVLMSASGFISTCMESWCALFIMLFIQHSFTSYPTPSLSFRWSWSSSTSPITSNLPLWPSGPGIWCCMFILMMCAFLSLLMCTPSYLGPSTIIWLPGSPSMGLLASWSLPGYHGGPLGSGEFLSLIHSSWLYLGHSSGLWMSPGTAILPTGLSGSTWSPYDGFFRISSLDSNCMYVHPFWHIPQLLQPFPIILDAPWCSWCVYFSSGRCIIEAH